MRIAVAAGCEFSEIVLGLLEHAYQLRMLQVPVSTTRSLSLCTTFTTKAAAGLWCNLM